MDPEREWPMVDVRCGPPRTDDNQATLFCECNILIGTKADDDRDHAVISGIYEASGGVLDGIFANFRQQAETTDPLKSWLAQMTALTTSGHFQFGGFTFGAGLAPYDDAGINMMGLTMNVHYGRSDF